MTDIPQIRRILDDPDTSDFVKGMIQATVLNAPDPEERMLEFMLIYDAAKARFKHTNASQLENWATGGAARSPSPFCPKYGRLLYGQRCTDCNCGFRP